MISRSLADLSKEVGCEMLGDGDALICGVGSLENGQSGQIGFIQDPKYLDVVDSSRLSALIVKPSMAGKVDRDVLLSANPHLTFARIAAMFQARHPTVGGVHSSALISESARLGEDVSIGPGVVISDGVWIGEGSQIGPGCVVQRGTRIGANSILVANVTICHDVEIGTACIFHPGVVIGSDGFGLAQDGEGWEKVPQLGSVRIGDNCEVGANSTIDRGALDDTVLGNGVKIDNLVQVAHNVCIGDHTAIAACSGVAGSAKIGKRCRIAGSVGVLGHLEISDDVTIMAKSLVTKSIREPGVYSSAIPAGEHSQWGKQLARLRRLDALSERVSKLEQIYSKKTDD